VRKKKITAAVQLIHQLFIVSITRPQTKADEIKVRWRHDFEARVLPHPLSKLLCQAHVFADVILQSLDTVMPNYEPQF
jgi:hypothetical protein